MGTKTILSWEEFLAAAQEGHKSEWVDAEVILMTPVGLWHEAILARLVRRLEEYCQSDTEWICFTSNAVFTMASGNWRCPDASLVRKNRFPGGVISATKADFPPRCGVRNPLPQRDSQPRSAQAPGLFGKRRGPGLD